MKRVVLTVTLFCVFLLCIAPVCGLDKPEDDNQLVREKIKSDRKRFVGDNMQLTEVEARAFWPVYESYQKDLSSLNDRAGTLIADFAKSYRIITDRTAKKLLDDMIAIENDRINLRQNYLPKFRQVLPEKKVVRYYQLENKIYAVVSYDLARTIPLMLNIL
jgi:hypothetical protein